MVNLKQREQKSNMVIAFYFLKRRERETWLERHHVSRFTPNPMKS